MTIESLERYQTDERAGILAALALATSPNPGIDSAENSLSVEQQYLLAEIAKKIGVAKNQFSENLKERLDNYIARALSDAVLGTKDINAILGRAGEAGKLPPSLYTVDIDDAFRSRFSPLRVSDNDVRTTVLHCDDIEHLEMADKDTVSLFTRFVENKERRDPFWALAHLHRRGRTLQAHCYWRIYPSEIDITSARSPLDVLIAFINLLGTDIEINGRRRPYFRDEKVELSDGRIKFTAPMEPDAVINFSVGTCSPEAHIVLGYAISLPKYRAYLRSHNVAIR